MSKGTLIAKFCVVSKEGDATLPTQVCHHVDTEGYELFSITQKDTDSDEYITVLLHRDQLVSLASQANGH